MGFFKRLIDVLTLGSVRPMRRLAAYYVLLGLVGFVVFHFFPMLDGLLSGEPLDQLAKTPSLLQDGLGIGAVQPPVTPVTSRLLFGLSTGFVMLSTLALMLPVTWVYMSARTDHGHDQTIVQVLIVLPMIVAGIVLIVRNSLALAFSLGGVVAAVRFRTTLADARDIVFIFLAIAVGFAAGVQVIMVALLLSMLFNFVLLVLWRYDFGRTVLEPTAAAAWEPSMNALATTDKGGNVIPDRDLVIALTPTKVDELAKRFARIQLMLGDNPKRPRFDAIVSVTTTNVSETQRHVESSLEKSTKRWHLDEIVTNIGKPSALFYLVRMRRSVNRDALLTAIRMDGAGALCGAEVEIGDAIARELGEQRAERKRVEAHA